MKGAKTRKARRGTSRETAGAQLEISTTGGFSLALSGMSVDVVSHKAKAVLGYLAVGEQGVETRERLVGLFWSEASEANARASLRQVLHEVRVVFQAAGFDGLQADKRSIALERALVKVDLHEIVEMAQAGKVHRRFRETARLPETLLAEFEDVDPAFRLWLLAKRQALHDRLLVAFETAMRAADSASERESELARAIVSLDPTHEEACRALIRACASRGDFGGAMRLYKSLWDLLDQEFDVEPSVETQALIVEVRNATTDDRAPASKRLPLERTVAAGNAPPAGRDLVLNVGAFDSSATQESQRYIVNGFRHELVASLVRFREWRVRDDSGNSGPVDAGGQEYRIDASAMSTPTDIRLVLTLREARTGLYVWSDQYRITLSNWFEAQQAIVRRIAVGLNIHLSASRLSRLTAEHDASPHAYDRWLRAQEMILKFSSRAWAQAADIFRSTIVDTPNFSPAYSSLVQINNTAPFVHPGTFRTPQRDQETLEFAKRAVELDPVDSRAQLAMGWAYAVTGNFATAGIHMELALELNEYDPWTTTSLGLFYAFTARPDKARQLARHALNLAPNPSVTQWVYASTIFYATGDYRDCVMASQRSGDAIWSNVAWRAAARFQLGEREPAREEMRRFFDGLRRQWEGEHPATEANMTRWLLHLYSIEHEETWERLRAGLAGAGAPVDGTRHGTYATGASPPNPIRQ
ncbi:MAG: BTAD domain-containing putative transcriptional regulator [Reyranella sp.]|uniref:BTAD domain-containing putative transcriptional regulator n=1 Tax=Reyranella sp. TaxID=1929291 RepID=UPI003D149479